MAEQEKLRIDKYLWAIRIFKTRTMATEACKAGKVKLNGTNVKPGAVVKPGDVYTITKGIERKVIKVVDYSYNRTDYPTAQTKYEDLTPPGESDGFFTTTTAPILRRDRGTGRPTKRDRRKTDEVISGVYDAEDED